MQLHRDNAAIRARGAQLVLIGIGPPYVIEAFRQDTGVTASIRTDPTLATYRALGLRRGMRTMLSFALIRHSWRALRAGYRNDTVTGDPVQHGGVLVVRPGGVIAYRQISRTAGDHAPVADILAAL
ncbi:MAG: peroxiredoxin-like family protein [Vicinamibacterales bacterium]